MGHMRRNEVVDRPFNLGVKPAKFTIFAKNTEWYMFSRMALVICSECDSLQEAPALFEGAVLQCYCCGSRLYASPTGGLDVTLALMLGSLVLYLLANLFPLLTLEIQGLSQTTTITGAAIALFRQDMEVLAVVVWLTSVLLPGLIIFGAVYILSSLRFSLNLPARRRLLLIISHIQPWGMMDVFILGMLVALVKLSGTADIILGPGIAAFAALVVLFALAMSRLEIRQLWNRLDMGA
jgi:paraquat-inducible protein A